MSSLEELVASAISLRRDVSVARPVLLGIVGPPGSGKSTLTTALHSVLTDWSVIEMDGFHLSNEVLVSLGRRDRKGAPRPEGGAGHFRRRRFRRVVAAGREQR